MDSTQLTLNPLLYIKKCYEIRNWLKKCDVKSKTLNILGTNIGGCIYANWEGIYFLNKTKGYNFGFCFHI